MKTIKFLRAFIVLLGLVLGACAPAALPSAQPANVGGGKAVSEVIFTGIIESMDGNQWVIDGQTVTVDSSVLKDGPFAVGDTVKVEAAVAEDGSVTAQRVETPSAADLAGDSPAPTEAPTSAPSDGTVQSLVFDDSGNEAFGTLETLTDTSITVGGQTFTLAAGAEINGQLEPGAFVKLHFATNADGTLSVTEVEIADPSQVDDNSNDDNSNDINGNDNSNDDNGNDDNGNDDNSNDDNGNGNSNDDSNDDNGGGSNSNDDNGSGGGNDDNGGSDDNSGGGNSNDD